MYRISGIGNKSLSNGTDIIFVDDDDTTRLHHDLISFSGYTGNAWVQILLLEELTDKHFYMYYGNQTGGDQTTVTGYKPSSTWDDTFVFVSHMKDDSTNKKLTDSSKWQVPMWKSTAGDPEMVKTFMGSGQRWDNNSSAFISTNTFNGLSTITTETTLEVIVSGTGIKAGEYFGYVLGMHNKPTDTGVHGTWLYIGERGKNSVYYKISSSEPIAYSPAVLSYPYWPSTNLAHTEIIAGSYRSAGEEPTVTIHIGGHNLYDYDTAGVGTLGLNWAGLYMGQRPADSSRSFSGSILHARLSNVYRDYGWHQTVNYNISSLSAKKNYVFYDIGTEESKPSEPENWYDSSWLYRKQITINAACVKSSQTNIPILYRISGIGNLSKSDGTDIIFVDEDDETRLHHDPLNFVNYTGNVWIQIPTLTHNTAKTFYMYFGNLTGGDKTTDEGYKPSSAWDDTFAFVCHMKDYSNNKQLKDSSKYQADLWKSTANNPTMTKSFLGSSQKWASSDDFISSNSNIEGLLTLKGQASLEILVSGTGIIDAFGYIFQFKRAESTANWHGISFYEGKKTVNTATFYYSTNRFRVGAQVVQPYWPSTNIVHTEMIGTSFKSGAVDGKSHMYMGGNRIGGAAVSTYGLIDNADALYIGQRPADATRSFEGNILELRLSNTYRDSGWFKTTSYNISSLSAGKNYIFYTIGSIENVPTGEETDVTSFITISGSSTGWGWGKAKIDTTYAPRSSISNGNSWTWSIVDGTATMYIPSGTKTGWKWCSETAGLAI